VLDDVRHQLIRIHSRGTQQAPLKNSVPQRARASKAQIKSHEAGAKRAAQLLVGGRPARFRSCSSRWRIKSTQRVGMG
jgi:hypothetical protein